jgi:hypothetical protein
MDTRKGQLGGVNAQSKFKLEKQCIPTPANKKKKKGNKMTLVQTTHQLGNKRRGAKPQGGSESEPSCSTKTKVEEPRAMTFLLEPMCSHLPSLQTKKTKGDQNNFGT